MNQTPAARRSRNGSFRHHDMGLRKLLRCKRTKAFLTQDGVWTHDFQKALTLTDPLVPKALREYLELEELEIYYSFDSDAESQYDFALSAR